MYGVQKCLSKLQYWEPDTRHQESRNEPRQCSVSEMTGRYHSLEFLTALYTYCSAITKLVSCCQNLKITLVSEPLVFSLTDIT